jgi:hypothetical protein
MAISFPGSLLVNCPRCQSRYAIRPGLVSVQDRCRQCGHECLSTEEINRLFDLIGDLLSYVDRMDSLCRDLDVSVVLDPSTFCLPQDPTAVHPGFFLGIEGLAPSRTASSPQRTPDCN